MCEGIKGNTNREWVCMRKIDRLRWEERKKE